MYVARGSGFTLQFIDGIILTVYRYTPMVGASYSCLNEYTDNNDRDSSEGEKENDSGEIEDKNNFNIINLQDNSEAVDNNNSEGGDLEGAN